MFLLQRRLLMTTSVAALSAATVAVSDAETLAGSETDALAIVYTDDHFKATTGFNGSVYCLDSGTPANDYDNSPTTEGSSYFTYTSPSPKMILHDDGELKYNAHNLVTYSDQLDNVAYTKNRCTVSANATTDANGDSLADKIIEDGTASSSHGLYQQITAVSGAKYYIAVDLKAAERTFAFVELNGTPFGTSAGFYVNLSTGAITGTTSGTPQPTDKSITDLGSGWYRVTCVATASAAGSAGLGIYLSTADGTVSYNGDNSSGLYASRFQITRYPADTTYLKTTSAARYADPIEFNSSGTALGALVEPQRTNLVAYSRTATGWIPAAATYSVGSTLSVDGANNCVDLVADGTSDIHYVYHNMAGVVGSCTASVYVKYNDLQYLQLFANGPGLAAGNQYCNFDVQAGSHTGTKSAGVTNPTVVDMGSGVYRLSFTVAVGSTNTVGLAACALAADTASYAPSNTASGTYHLYGWQFELGSSATSPIETFGSTVTRAADNIDKAVTAYAHSATVNSGMVEYVPKGSAATATVALRWDDGTANEVVSIGHDASGNIGLTVTDGGAAQTAPLTSGTVTNDATETIGFSWKANDFLLSDNGATAVADTSGTLPTVTTLKIGSSGGPIYVKRILIVPVEKTAAEVEAYGAL